MKYLLASILVVAPTVSFAKEIKKDISPALAATIVRQEGVEKCLAVVENNAKGVASFDSIVRVGSIVVRGDSSVTKYKLSGSNLFGDVMAGSWEIEVEQVSSELGSSYTCKITKNEE